MVWEVPIKIPHAWSFACLAKPEKCPAVTGKKGRTFLRDTTSFSPLIARGATDEFPRAKKKEDLQYQSWKDASTTKRKRRAAAAR
jgi:hypothetical protein